MRFTTPSIAWHDTKPVFSLDFHSSGRLATAGADFSINIWRVEKDGSVTFLSQLLKHTRPVNAVKFSPDGRLLASTGDDGIIYIWKLAEGIRQVQGMMDSSMPQIEKAEEWTIVSTLSRGGHDLYSLDWSADSTQLVTGAFDGAVYIWHLTKQYGQRYHEIKDHWNLVQGVSFDPLNSMLVTQSADRSVRIYKKSKRGHKLFCSSHLRVRVTDIELENKKAPVNQQSGVTTENTEEKRYFQHKYFQDDSAPTFFRRPGWSPDGNFLLLPCGQCLDSPSQDAATRVTWLFTRANYNKPAFCIPSAQISIAARFSPILYKTKRLETATNRSENNKNSVSNTKELNTTTCMFDIPYKMVFAIANLDSIFIYDTDHLHPIAAFEDGHYDILTDLAWSPDGNILAVSSTDGYVSLIQFDEDELGQKLDDIEYERIMAPVAEAKIPKTRVTKTTSEPNDGATTQNRQGDLNGDVKLMQTDGLVKESDTGDESESDSDMEDEDAQGSIINFNDPPSTNDPIVTPSVPRVRKEGKRVVPTIISSTNAMDVDSHAPTIENAKN